MFQAGNLDAAVDAVLAHSQDQATLQRVGLAARGYITEHRQWRNNILQLAEFYAQVGRKKQV
jgi:hypothetical protein